MTEYFQAIEMYYGNVITILVATVFKSGIINIDDFQFESQFTLQLSDYE